MNRTRAVLAVFAVALLGGGWLVRRGLATPSDRAGLSEAQGARLLQAVMRRFQDSWADSISTDELYRLAALGTLGELGDPNTSYLPPNRLRRLREVTSGSYVGIGASIDSRDGWLTVSATRMGMPAERAGLQVGDRIVEIDGRSTKGWTFDEARNALRGPASSGLSLTVERRFGAGRVKLDLQRSDIRVSSVSRVMVLAGGVGYFWLTSYTDSTATEVAHAVDSLVRGGARSLVIDLRGNPGGVLSQGVAMADLFLDAGQRIVSTKGRPSSANTSMVDRAPQRWPQLPIAVLVNAFTASSAEIVAGALQDHDRAIVVGRPSFGKGSAQTVIPLDGGGALKVTNVLWYTPAGRSIDRPHATRGTSGADADTARPQYRTDRGRVVVGGGGIVPDVLAGDSTASAVERRWVEAVGTRVRAFRDALTAHAEAVTRGNALRDPGFVVTEEMRDGLWRAMASRGVHIPRDVFNDARETIDRVLGLELARQAFGVTGAQARSVRSDPVVAKAASLLEGAASPLALLERVERLGTK